MLNTKEYPCLAGLTFAGTPSSQYLAARAFSTATARLRGSDPAASTSPLSSMSWKADLSCFRQVCLSLCNAASSFSSSAVEVGVGVLGLGEDDGEGEGEPSSPLPSFFFAGTSVFHSFTSSFAFCLMLGSSLRVKFPTATPIFVA